MTKVCNYSGMDSAVPYCFVERPGEPWYCKFHRFVGDGKYCGRDPRTVIICMTNRCNLRCKGTKYGCIAGCQKLSADRLSVVDIDAALAWMDKYTPGADVQITGGEPFILPGIVGSIKKVIKAGHRVSVFSNGTMLSRDEEAYNLPVAWQLTHHYATVPFEDFMRQVRPLRHRPHILCRILGRDEEPNPEIAARYEGFNFKWIRNGQGFIDHALECEWDLQPNAEMLLIGIKGEVFSCSAPNRQYGNIYNMTFDRDAAMRYTCPGRYPDGCQSCHSIELLRAAMEGA